MSTLQINNTKYKNFKIAAAGSTAALVLGGMAFLQPFSLTNNSYAEETGKTSALDMSVTLNPTISIWTTDTSDNEASQVDIAADPDESVATGTIRTHVSTNNLTGYTLTIQSNSTDAKMVHENGDVSATINPLTGFGISKTNWANNKDLNNMWGYSIGNNDSFLGVPGSAGDEVTIDSTEAPNNGNHTDVTFAAKADLSLPAGTYTDTVIFSAVANAVPTPIVDGMNMQDVTQAMCAETPLYSDSGITYTLVDDRDKSEYKVRKLADGNCWMVQNLRLVGSRNLTSANSNVSADFTLTASDNSTWCKTNDSACDDKSMVYYNNDTTYGAYYNWYAATAGTGTYSLSSFTTPATSSICPKSGDGSTSSVSWHLPTGKSGGEWYNLLVTKGGLTDQANNTPFASKLGDTSPYTFVLSGLRNGASVTGSGSSGFGSYWSSTAGSNNYAYNADVNYSGYLNAGTHYYYKYYGNSVRCVLTAAGS